MVRTQEGEVCEDAEAAQDRWREYFSAMEAGECFSVPGLAERLLQAMPHAWPVPETTHLLPGMPDLARLMISSKQGKAAGMDGLPNELLRHYAPEAAEILHPLLLKLLFRGTEAIGLKGGLAVWCHKGKGAKDLCESYRQILLLSGFAKILHQAVRPAIREVFLESTPTLQLGGKPGQSVCFGAHMVRSFLRYNLRAKRSCFVLFTDIATAFYSVVRQLVAAQGDSGSQGSTLPDAVYKGMKLSAGELARLQEHVAQPSSLRRVGASRWLEALADKVSDNNTWFMLRGDQQAILTHRGTRPGSSWADVLFGMIIARVLEERDSLEFTDQATPISRPRIPWDGQKTLQPCPSSTQQIELGDVVWADDVATMRVCDKPRKLAASLALSSGSLCDACANFGFRLSFGPNKTAAIMQPSGPGTRAAARELFGPDGHKGAVQALREDSPPIRVPLVGSYRHLGSLQTPKGALTQELRYRAAQAWAKFSEGRRKVYKAKGISVRRKAFLLRSSVLPKLSYGAGSWPCLRLHELRTLGGTLWSLYRAICGIPATDDQYLHSCTILAITGLPSVQVTLHCQRLSYLKLLLKSGPDELWPFCALTKSILMSCAVHFAGCTPGLMQHATCHTRIGTGMNGQILYGILLGVLRGCCCGRKPWSHAGSRFWVRLTASIGPSRSWPPVLTQRPCP